jgi:hypothetical protein
LAKSYVVQHWRGELSLGAAFWISGIVALVVAVISAKIFGKGAEHPGMLAWMSTGGFCLTLLAFTTWYSVGVWRSANPASAGGLGLVTRVALVVGVLATLTAVVREALQVSREMRAQKDWLNQNAKWEFRLLRNDQELAISGGIGIGFAKDLERTLSEHPRLKVLHTNLSRGGLLEEARQAATSVRIRALTTYVSVACVSACTLVYLAGNRRALRRGARLGFHSVSAPGLRGRALIDANAQMIEYLYSRGVALDFARHAILPTPDTYWFPGDPELLKAGVVHQIDDGSLFATTEAGLLSKEQIQTALLEQRLYRVLKAKHGETYAKFLSSLEDAMRAGSSKSELGEISRRTLQPYLESALPRAGDAAILRFARLLSSKIAVLERASERACAAYLEGGELGISNQEHPTFSEDLRNEEMEAMADVFDSTEGRPRENPRETDRQLARIRARLRSKLSQALTWQLRKPLPRAPRCEEANRYFIAALNLAPADAALLFRSDLAKKE